jgi:hypothetical protein
MASNDQPLNPSDSPQPFCPHCKHALDPKNDVLYQGISLGSVYSIIYCGWCGAVLGGGPSSGMHLLGTKTERGS